MENEKQITKTLLIGIFAGAIIGRYLFRGSSFIVIPLGLALVYFFLWDSGRMKKKEEKKKSESNLPETL